MSRIVFEVVSKPPIRTAGKPPSDEKTHQPWEVASILSGLYNVKKQDRVEGFFAKSWAEIMCISPG